MAKQTDVFEQQGTVSEWDDDYYHPVAERYYDMAIPWMLNALGCKPGDSVVDAGCGPGVHSIRAAKYGCRVTGLDVSATMLAHARERAAAAGVADQIDYRQENLTEFTLPEPVPAIFSWGVIIHVPQIEAVLDHLAAAVAPGGRLALQVLNRHSLDNRLEFGLRGLMRKPLADRVDSALGTGNWYDYQGERLWVMRFDTDALSQALAKRGLKFREKHTAEFSEFQRRMSGLPRKAMLHLNLAAYRANLLSGLSATQILVYERPR